MRGSPARAWCLFALTASVLLALPLAATGPEEIRATAVPLNPRDPGERRAGALEYLAGFELSGSGSRWGGFSAMALTGGDKLLAVSDLGNWLQLRLAHDADGRLIGVGEAETGYLPGPDGKALPDKGAADAEGLTVTSDGALLVSFERDSRIWRYPGDPPFAGPPTSFPAPRASVMLPENNGLESIVALPGGDVLTISEGTERGENDIAGWLWRDARWHPLAWTRTRPFRPTDATLMPDGSLLVLERRFSFAGGAGARLSRVAPEAIAPGAHLAGEVLAELRPPHSVDNFEAVAAAPAPGGGTLIYILSDDNRNFLQRTLLLQFRWRP